MNKTIDAIEEAIDAFEASWSPERPDAIERTLREWGLADDADAVAELARIDIERRYHNGLACNIDRYLTRFPSLTENLSKAAEVAYEDYRVRLRLGHPVAPERYEAVPGLQASDWYRELCSDTPPSLTVRVVEHDVATKKSSLESPSTWPPSTNETPIEEDDVASLLERVGFTIMRSLGHGSFGRVYLARQNDLAERYVVLKLMRNSQVEPQMMAMLQHTNIVPIYSYHWIDSVCVICMPYAGELTLQSYMRSLDHAKSRDGKSIVQTIRHRDDDVTPLRRLSLLDREQLSIFLFSRLASALAHSHDRSVLHGDIKPANILIREDGEPALLDFNLSRHTRQSSAAGVGGTYAYMAPETMRELVDATEETPSKSLIDHRADIYGLGVVMFEFMTGRPPYPRPASGLHEHLRSSLDSRRSLPEWNQDDSVSSGLRSIINRCLAYEPKDRYADASHLQEDLLKHASHKPLRYTSESLSQKFFKFTNRHPRSTSGLAVSVSLGVLLLPLLFVFKSISNRSDQLQSALHFAAFEDASNESLLNAMADPHRFEAEGVASIIKPLESFSVLTPQTLDGWLNSGTPSDAETERRRAILYRHVAQAAISEGQRLRALQFPDSTSNDIGDWVDRYTLLIEVAKQIASPKSPPSLMHLEADLATFRKDDSQRTKQVEWAPGNTSGSMQRDDNEAYLEAVRLMAMGRWRLASDLFKSLADGETIPSTLRWTYLGRSQYQLGDFEDAKLSFTQSLERAPQSASLWLLRGLCYRKLRNISRAESDFREAIRLKPDLVSAHHKLAETLLLLDQPKAATEQLSQALEVAPDHVAMLLLRSRALARLGDHEAAARDRSHAYSLTNLSATELLYRAQQRTSEDAENALADVTQALEKMPRSVPLLHQLATSQTKLGKVEDAIDTLAKLQLLAPDDDKVTVDRAVLLARVERFEEARTELQRAIVQPNSGQVLYQAACVCALLPDPKSHARALGFLSAAIQRGHGAAYLKSDSDLDSLRELQGFQAILRTTQLATLPDSFGNGPNDLSPSLDLDF